MVIDNELKNVMRSHHDLEKDNTPYMKKALRVRSILFISDSSAIRFSILSASFLVLLAFNC